MKVQQERQFTLQDKHQQLHEDPKNVQEELYTMVAKKELELKEWELELKRKEPAIIDSHWIPMLKRSKHWWIYGKLYHTEECKTHRNASAKVRNQFEMSKASLVVYTDELELYKVLSLVKTNRSQIVWNLWGLHIQIESGESLWRPQILKSW